MALSHSEATGNFPSEELVQKAMTAARSRWASNGLDPAMCARLERRLSELAANPTGRYILVNGGINGFWTNYLTCDGCDSIRNQRGPRNFANDVEEYLAEWFAKIRGEQELLLRNIIGPLLKPGHAVASVPCGLMTEVLLAADHFENLKLYAIDIDKTNFALIREKYGERLVGNEFHTIEMDAQNLDFECAFDLITCLGFVMYLKEERVPEFLSRLHRALKPGGRLLISFSPDHSEQSPLFKFNARRLAVVHDIFMCAEARFSTRLPTSTLMRHLTISGFVRIIINGGTYYHLPFIDATKASKEVLNE